MSTAAQPNAVEFHPTLTSLYVGDLDEGVTDERVLRMFSQVGEVVSVRVCKDVTTQRSLGYAYVNFADPEDAEKAIELLNFETMNGKPMRIMYSHRDPSVRKSGAGNVFVKNLDKDIDNKWLHDIFCDFGTILSCKIATYPSGKSKGYGFVQFQSEEDAQKAIGKLNGMLLNDKQVYVGPFLRKQERENNSGVNETKFTNVFVKNLDKALTDEDLAQTFEQFGKITSAVVMREVDGSSRGFGFVNFKNVDDAARAVDALNGKKFGDKEWYVGKAQKKYEREAELKKRFEESVKLSEEKYQANLYIKNLDDSINDDDLKELFSPYGSVTSTKVMLNHSGVSKGAGFVSFSTSEEASRAQKEMNGKIVINKPLYVALAQRKEDRVAKLQAQFSQLRPAATGTSVVSRMPMYLPNRAGHGQPIYPGQTSAAGLLASPTFGYQNQLMSGVKTGAATGFFMPLVGASRKQYPPPKPAMQQQMWSRGSYRYAPSRVQRNAPFVPGGVPQGNAPTKDGASSSAAAAETGALATLLANATIEQQKALLEENLYPLVEKLVVPEMVEKVTGMLLEMDQTEVLHLLESPDALKVKVAEAIQVLRTTVVVNNDVADQLAGFPLGDHLA